MTAVRFALGVVLAAFVHLAGTAVWSGFPVVADPFLVAAVVAGLAGRPERALVAGTVAGWAADALAGGPFGLYGFADAAVAYATALAAQRIVVDRPATAAGLFAAAAGAQGGLLMALGLVFRGAGETLAPLELLLRGATTAALGLGWLALARAAASRWRRRGRRPSGGVSTSKALR
jgi:rod shape-determining protein MreD